MMEVGTLQKLRLRSKGRVKREKLPGFEAFPGKHRGWVFGTYCEAVEQVTALTLLLHGSVCFIPGTVEKGREGRGFWSGHRGKRQQRRK